MNRSILPSWAVLLIGALFFMLLTPADAHAENPIIFRWETRAIVESSTSWNGSQLMPEGYGHFTVNGVQLPTRTVPGEYKKVLWFYGGTNRQIEANFNAFEAPLVVPHGIMRVGANDMHFSYGNVRAHAYTHDSITARGAAVGNLPLFRLAASDQGIWHWYGPDDGRPRPDGIVDGDEIQESQLHATINLTLEQLAPQLVADIKRFEAAIAQDQNTLVANAAQVANLAVQLENLARLKSELTALLARDLGEDLAQALEDLLARYTEIPAATREALVKIVNDVQKSIADMRAELDRITSDFAEQTENVVGTVEHPAAENGWNGDDMSNYTTSIDPNTIPGVTVPDTSGTITFDAAHDPYAAYAAQIVTKLGEFVQSGDVIDRATFISIVRGWRDNQKALESALRARGFPVAETAAFNTARNLVTDYLRRYLDGKEWFVNNPVPPEVRDAVDRILAAHFLSHAERLKDALNEWRGTTLTAQQRLATETVGALAAASEDVDPDVLQAEEILRFRSALDGVIGGIKGSLHLGAGFTPILGDAVDFCEAVTGHEFCSSTGKGLSTSDRVMSGLGVIFGSGQFWRKAAHGVGIAANAVVLGHVAKVADRFADLPAAERKALLRRIGHVVAHLDDIPASEIRRLADRFGDAAIMQLSPKLKGSGLQQLEKMEFFLPRFNAAVRTAATTRGAAVKALPRLEGKSLTEIRGILQQADFAKDAGSTAAQEVWIHRVGAGGDGSVIRIAPNGTARRPYPHLKKEISFNLGYLDPDIACKLTDAGVPVAQGSNEAEEILRQWFRATVGEAPEATEHGSLDTMARIWGDFTHLRIGP